MCGLLNPSGQMPICIRHNFQLPICTRQVAMGDRHASSVVRQIVVDKSQWGECLQETYREQILQGMRSNMQLMV